MFFNLRICRLFGADIYIHSTFFMFAFVFMYANVNRHGFEAAPIFAAYYACAFASVLVHEYGHVLVARLHGIDCRKITLHGLGGLAQLDQAPVRPRDEFLIAAAGPATSVGLYAALALAAEVLPQSPVQDFISVMAVVNIFIAGFNMIPAYPLDGGQMLHALLRTFLGEDAARTVASRLAQALGAGMVAFGWHYGLVNMMLIGGLLFFLTPSALGRGWMWRSGRQVRPDASASTNGRPSGAGD
jgi:Zn-dependent proteases